MGTNKKKGENVTPSPEDSMETSAARPGHHEGPARYPQPLERVGLADVLSIAGLPATTLSVSSAVAMAAVAGLLLRSRATRELFALPVAGAPQRPEVASIPEPGAAPPTPSAAPVQVQASQAESEPTAAPPQAESQGGSCSAPLLGSSASASGLGDLMLLGTVVGSLLISSRLRRR